MNVFAQFASVAPRLGATLVHSLWQGIVVAVALGAALRLMRSSSSVSRYAVCCAAIVLFVVIVACTFVALEPLRPRAFQAVSSALAVDSPAVFPVLAPLEVVEPADAVPAIDPMRWAGFAWLLASKR